MKDPVRSRPGGFILFCITLYGHKLKEKARYGAQLDMLGVLLVQVPMQ
jgi:hypothetical protein